MSFILLLFVGAFVGWIGSMMTRTDARQGIMLHIVIGIAGVFLGHWIFSALVAAGTINQGGSRAVEQLVSIGGAILLLAIMNILRRRMAS